MNRKFVCKPLLPPHLVSLLRYRLCLPPGSHSTKYKEAPGLAWRPSAVLLSVVNIFLITAPLLSLCCSLTFLTLQCVIDGTWQLINKKIPACFLWKSSNFIYVYIIFKGNYILGWRFWHNKVNSCCVFLWSWWVNQTIFQV